VVKRVVKSRIWFLPWVSALPSPQDGTAVLHALSQIPPGDRIDTLARYHMPRPLLERLRRVAAQGTWGEAEKKAVKEIWLAEMDAGGKRPSAKDIERVLIVWADADAHGEGLLAGLEAYQAEFFAEEEKRIRPALETAVAKAQQLAERLPLPRLLEELSQGVRFNESPDLERLHMIPSFWITPLTIFNAFSAAEETPNPIFVFGARPADASLVPGDVVPDALYQALKALADPTRLRILRYLSEAPLTPAALARRLRLRPPTVIHHLHALRLARLVHLTLTPDEGKRYAARREAVTAAFAMLEAFLDDEPLPDFTLPETEETTVFHPMA
jgi:DNA-binding transcriptional ArsR family regulator